MKNTSFSTLQKEAIKIFNRIKNGDKSIHQFETGMKNTVKVRSEKFPNKHFIFLYDFNAANTNNYIAIIYSAYSKFSGNFEQVKRVDFKYTQGLK